jgi:hypothetical protein
VIVETGLPDRNNLGGAGAGHEIAGGDVQLLMRVMRMRADRAIDVREALGDGEKIGLARHAGRDCDHARDAGGAGALDHRLTVGVELRRVQVDVAVDQHR